jgi:hypothetical protein
MRSAPNHRTPRSRLSEAPLARYWAEKTVAAMNAKMRIIPRLRQGRRVRFILTSRKKLNRGAALMLHGSPDPGFKWYITFQNLKNYALSLKISSTWGISVIIVSKTDFAGYPY